MLLDDSTVARVKPGLHPGYGAEEFGGCVTYTVAKRRNHRQAGAERGKTMPSLRPTMTIRPWVRRGFHPRYDLLELAC